MTFRSGFCCFVGRPNAGKSTLTNALVGSKIVITSDKPQTTRHAVRGIVTRDDAQLDPRRHPRPAPAAHAARRAAQRRRARDAGRRRRRRVLRAGRPDASAPATGSSPPSWPRCARRWSRSSPRPTPSSQAQVAEQLLAVSQLGDFADVVPVSAVAGDQVDLLADLLVGPPARGAAALPGRRDHRQRRRDPHRRADPRGRARRRARRTAALDRGDGRRDPPPRRRPDCSRSSRRSTSSATARRASSSAPQARGSSRSAPPRAPASRRCSASGCTSTCTSPSSRTGSATRRSSTGSGSDDARDLPRGLPRTGYGRVLRRPASSCACRSRCTRSGWC